jgi:hypothetical protein
LRSFSISIGKLATIIGQNAQNLLNLGRFAGVGSVKMITDLIKPTTYLDVWKKEMVNKSIRLRKSSHRELKRIGKKR